MCNYIKELSQQLVNQIAAGEIIERPASVVKELVENSLDAGAMSIFIDIELSGRKKINIIDDGCGIRKNELLLALTRHATSKIYTMDDLECINSMGFRGEALASISSVSRLILTSRTIDQKEAWKVYVEGSDIVNLKPAAHQVGTTVEVLDLFFNIPARRNFMCQNEFFYIDKVIRSIALSRFDVKFILQHNRKIVSKYFAVNSNKKEENLIRLSNLCSKEFANRAIEVYFKDKDLFIHGWLENPNIDGVDCKIQYIYINNRFIIFDSVIKNAISQVYSELLIKKKPAFVLFLDLDPYQVDINVHPKKERIIFRQKRKVYDFVYCAVSNIIKKTFEKNVNKVCKIEKDTINYKKWIETNKNCSNEEILYLDNKNIYSYENSIIKSVEDINFVKKDIIDSSDIKLPYFFVKNEKRIIKLLNIYKKCYALIEYVYCDILLLSLPVADNYIKKQQLIKKNCKELYAYTIIPTTISIDNKQSESIKNNKKILHDMGIILKLYNDKVIIKAVPLPLYDQNLIELIPELLCYMNNKFCLTYQQIAVWFTEKIKLKFDWSFSQAIKLLSYIEMFYPQLFTTKNKKILFSFNLKDAIKTINNEL